MSALKRPIRRGLGNRTVRVPAHTRRTPITPTQSTHRLTTLPKGATTHSRKGRKPQGPRYSEKYAQKRKFNGKWYKATPPSKTKTEAKAKAQRHRAKGKNKMARVEKTQFGWTVFTRG